MKPEIKKKIMGPSSYKVGLVQFYTIRNGELNTQLCSHFLLQPDTFKLTVRLVWGSFKAAFLGCIDSRSDINKILETGNLLDFIIIFADRESFF